MIQIEMEPRSQGVVYERKKYNGVYDRLRIHYKGHELYLAGFPGFPRIFFRDGVISARLRKDPEMMEAFLSFGAETQGKLYNPNTHEQPGAIFHEIDPRTGKGFIMEDRGNLSTEYNGCDTAAEFLIGHEEYEEWTGDKTLSRVHRNNIIQAANYISRHINSEGLYIESPQFSKARATALKVTYWRDSDIPGRENGIPAFPVVYTLAHIQSMSGLRAATRLLEIQGGQKWIAMYKRIAEKMKNALPSLYDLESGTFLIARDNLGPIQGYSTDPLHALYYLEPDDISRDQMMSVLQASQKLETPYGYRVLDTEAAKKVNDMYHAQTVWTHEQAVIMQGAERHFSAAFKKGDTQLASEFARVTDVASRVANYMNEHNESAPELRLAENGELRGCDPQLWAESTREYLYQDGFVNTIRLTENRIRTV